jgi:hypothetical protein
VTAVTLNRVDVKVCPVVRERRPIDPFVRIHQFCPRGQSARTVAAPYRQYERA